MTPDEAANHEFLSSYSFLNTSSSSSVNSNTLSSSTLETSQITSQGAQKLTIRTVHPPRQRATTMEEPQQQYCLYRMYSGRKEGDLNYSSGMMKSKLNGSASSHALTTGAQAVTSRHASTGDIVASLDPNLDDSGTFLPAIL